jgi:hypothetical protein
MSGSLQLRIDANVFARDYDRRPFKIEHRLVDHALLQLPRLVELAGRLSGQALYFRADHAINQVDGDDATTQPRTFVQRDLARPALGVAETVAAIESCSAWMQLRDVGKDPAYRALLDALFAEFRSHAEPITPGMSGARADIFVSSPHAMTPFHLDEEHNFLLQVRGTKQLSIADGSKREVLSEEHRCDFFRDRGELAPYSERLEELSDHVELGPGQGVHIPPCYPHWVKNGPAVSVSLGVLWHSDVTARRRSLYRVNDWLRRTGITPRPPGERPLLDSVKVLPFGLKRRVQRQLKDRLSARS